MSSSETSVDLHIRAHAREEGGVQTDGKEVDVRKERNAVGNEE